MANFLPVKANPFNDRIKERGEHNNFLLNAETNRTNIIKVT